MTDATRYPLSWPLGWPRTPADSRKPTRFTGTTRATYSFGGDYRRARDLTFAEARNRLDLELERLRARDVLLSTNVELTTYGEPRSGRRPPEDPGVAVYFRLNGKDRVLACDRWTTVAGNIAAIAAHVECIRGIDRYGVGTLDQAFAGYDALPAPGAKRSWQEVLGLAGGINVDVAIVEAAYRHLAKVRHPDRGGSHEAMAELNAARDQALAEIGNG